MDLTFSSYDYGECFDRAINAANAGIEDNISNDVEVTEMSSSPVDIAAYTIVCGLLCRLEKQFVEKYDGMSLKQLKEECAHKGISCSGLHYEYVKKLVIYEMEKRVLFSGLINSRGFMIGLFHGNPGSILQPTRVTLFCVYHIQIVSLGQILQ